MNGGRRFLLTLRETPDQQPLHYVLDGIHCEPHFFTVPLTTRQPDDEKSITLFGRTLCRQDKLDDELPWLLYLQGCRALARRARPPSGGWIKRALQEFRVLLLDQRGTGHSTPINAEALAGLTPVEQADYLGHFRADSIVRDAEYIRETLSPDRPWSLLGQSFGGFAASPISPCSQAACTRSTSPAAWLP